MTTAYNPRHLRSADYQRLYPSAAPDGAVARSWDIEITAAGAADDVWTLEFNGGEVEYTVIALDTTALVAAGLRTAAAGLVGVTVTGGTTHVILTVPGPDGPEDQPAAAPVLSVSPAGGTSTQAVVAASSTGGFGVTTVDQK